MLNTRMGCACLLSAGLAAGMIGEGQAAMSAEEAISGRYVQLCACWG